MSKGSCNLQASPPSRTRFHTLLNAGSSQRSILPPSMCGPSVNALGPGALIRNRSKYEIGVRALTIVSGFDVCQSESRYFCVSMRAGCVRARTCALEL